ncbi:unnamed protein product [Urochloa decumbens]|uniref:MADS-box domain-containing protein n=1 Tax=Urochloa decumbens TaxID=240449 RepID=A0ABC8WI89_9POAL
MPRRGGKVKIQWIMQKGVRQATFRKRHATLFDKARDLSILCGVPAAVVVYGGSGEAAAEPKVWPGVEEVREILQRHRDLPASLREAHRLDNEGFMRRRTGKMRKKVDTCSAAARRLEVNLVLNDVGLGRRREFDDMPRDLAAAAVSALDALRNVTADRLNFLRSGGAQVAAEGAAPQVEGAAALSLQEPLMVQPLAVAGPMVPNAPLVLPAPPPPQEVEEPLMVTPLAVAPMVAGAPLLLPAPQPEPAPLQPELVVATAPAPHEPLPLLIHDAPLLLPAPELEPAPPQSELLVAPPPPHEPLTVAEAPLLLPAPEQEPAPPQSDLVVPPAPQEPTMIADGSDDAPLLVPSAEPQPQDTAAGLGVDELLLNLDAEPRNRSFLLEMADAIMDDGSGRQATAEDVDRLLREHGLERFKPM